MEGAQAIGVVDHTGDVPEVAYLEQPLPVTQELLAMAAPLRPTEVFRFSAQCRPDICGHWSGSSCSLATRIVDLLPVRSLTLPKCHVRNVCRWFSQEGRAACARCPGVVTQNEDPSEAMRNAAGAGQQGPKQRSEGQQSRIPD
jgi:hypothetical protein